MLQINIEPHLRNIQYTVGLNFLIILKETIGLIGCWTSSEDFLPSSNLILSLTWLSSCLRKKLLGCQEKIGWDGDDHAPQAVTGPHLPVSALLHDSPYHWHPKMIISSTQAIRKNRINLRGGKTHLDLATLHASLLFHFGFSAVAT